MDTPRSHCGMTGTGKTNLAYQILTEFRRHNKPFLVFDWKRNYRELSQLPSFQDLRVYTIGRDTTPLRFNPLIPPPLTNPGEWLMKLVDVIKHAYFVGEGVEYLLRQAFDSVYARTASNGIPNFVQARQFVNQQPLQGRMALWKASARRVLAAIHPPEAIRKILDCLGLPSGPPPVLPAVSIDDLDFTAG